MCGSFLQSQKLPPGSGCWFACVSGQVCESAQTLCQGSMHTSGHISAQGLELPANSGGITPNSAPAQTPTFTFTCVYPSSFSVNPQIPFAYPTALLLASLPYSTPSPLTMPVVPIAYPTHSSAPSPFAYMLACPMPSLPSPIPMPSPTSLLYPAVPMAPLMVNNTPTIISSPLLIASILRQPSPPLPMREFISMLMTLTVPMWWHWSGPLLKLTAFPFKTYSSEKWTSWHLLTNLSSDQSAHISKMAWVVMHL